MPQMLTGYSQYDTFSAMRTHYHQNGLAMMPTAGIYPSLATVVALHGGLDYDVISYVATRRGEPPVVPSPETHNPNRVFLGGGRMGTFPIADQGGINGYAVSGWLIFGILSPEGLASNFYLGNMPFPGLGYNEYIPGNYFQYGLINDGINQTLTLQTGITDQ